MSCACSCPLINVPTILISLKISSGNSTHTISGCATCTIVPCILVMAHEREAAVSCSEVLMAASTPETVGQSLNLFSPQLLSLPLHRKRVHSQLSCSAQFLCLWHRLQ